MKTRYTKKTMLLTGAVTAALSSLTAFGQNFTNNAGAVQQGTTTGAAWSSPGNPPNNPAVTISFAGQTALKAFDESGGITDLAPGTSIVLHDGTGGAPVTYTAPSGSSTIDQLASKNFTTPDVYPGSPQINSAIALEWHAEGSVDGFYDLINDEIGYAGGSPTNVGTPISNEALRVPSSSNATYINQNTFTANGSLNGFSLSGSGNLAATYNSVVYNQATGVNVAGGQNRVQFSVGEYPTEAFAVSGTASPFATPGSAGYGQGNPSLQAGATLLTALGQGGARQQFQSATIANEATTTLDPQTDAAYAAGPWNTAGANNITSTAFAVTAVTYSANPGTGLERLNESDTQWLQTTGRLQNGAMFNVVARTVDTGQRVVFALNTGIDPSWAVGSNDDGNSTSSASANAQHSIGASLRFDGKTSGSEAETTISQSRMGVGALSVPEARGAGSTAPIRALDIGFNYTSSTDPTLSSPGSDDGDTNAEFVRANANTIESSNSTTRYQATLISHYNTVKTPNATALNQELATLYGAGSNQTNTTSAQQQTAWAAVQTFDPAVAETDGTSTLAVSGIKGDTTGDVAAFLSNIVNSVGTAAAGVTTTSAANPADELFANGYLIPGLLDYTRQTDGGAITPVTLSSGQLAEQSQVNSNFGNLLTTDNTSASNNQTIGSGAYYGAGNTGAPTINTNIPITAKDVTVDGSGNITGWSTASNKDLTAAGGNYLFGNFNQNGVRDLSAVEQSVNAALSLYAVDSTYSGGGSDSIYAGAPNNTVIPSLSGNPGWQATSTNTKGDLIVLGDYNGDGKFDGEDVYLLAIGASLADNNTANGLTANATTFADVVRNPNDVLRKNYALNYVNNYLNTTTDTTGAAFLRKTAAAVLTGYNPATVNVSTGTNPVTGQPNYIPTGATDLGTTDPITGLEQYTYDPTGANAFNPSDVNRDGTVDFNDAVLVDQYNGQSYQNLTQSLAATAQTPVTGAIEPISLVVVQQVDGESAIGSADLAVENAALTGVGNSNWYGYNVQKTGPGTITWARTGGTVTVYAGASFEVSSGVVQIGGTIDPFTDNTTGGITTGNHVAVAVDGGGKLQITQSFSTLNVAGLTINTASNSTVDIGTNALIINNSSDPIATIQAYLSAGYNGGAWNGPGGIVTSAPLTFDGLKYGLGYADGKDGVVSGLSSGQIEVKYTLLGDANLDGLVNGSDFNILAANFNQSITGWDQGDFNYDGLVNATDFNVLAANFNQGINNGASAGDVAALDAFAAANGLSIPTSAVPEPASLGLLTFGAVGILARRRRRES
ncbi:MAG: PEP-CTERM sorting domain-containing protein [Tepidisphaeraceae bacterium]|jgi:hypothetical protein